MEVPQGGSAPVVLGGKQLVIGGLGRHSIRKIMARN